MERSKLILWSSVGVAALMIVVVVGFIAPAGNDDNGDAPGQGGPRPVRSTEIQPGPVDMLAGEPLPEDPVELRMRRDQMRQEWDQMTEQQREQFRRDMRQRLAEAARRGGQQQRQYEMEQQRMLQMMIERRQTAAPVVDSPKDPNQ